MARKSKRTSAPAPAPPQPAPSAGAHPIPPPGFPPMAGTGAWFPSHHSQSTAPSAPCWLAGVQQPDMVGSSSQGPWWATAGVGPSAYSVPPARNLEDWDVQAWGVNSNPPGGFLSFMKNTLSNGDSPQQINIGDDDDDIDCTRTEKRLVWTKEEDLRLVGAWLNNSNDPIDSNYKKNDQYWKDVAASYNSTTPKSRARPVKQVKTRFAKIKKKVQWFCASWKEANALYASGESDIDLMERAIKTYEADHKTDGPFMFKHCWDVLRKEPKWDAYLERLQELEPDKRNFSTCEDVGQHFSLDATADERPIGGKQAKEQLKRKRKDQACIIDLEGELNKFVDAQNAANEGRKEMLEIQKRVSSENLEARKLALLAAKEQKEATMLETYRSLIVQDTTVMSEDVRSEHVLALRCLREKLFSNND